MSYLGFSVIGKIVTNFLQGKSVKDIAAEFNVPSETVQKYTLDANLVSTINRLNDVLERKDTTIETLRVKIREYRDLATQYRLQLQSAQKRLEKIEHGNSKQSKAAKAAHVAVVKAITEKNKEIDFTMPDKKDCVELEKLKLCSKDSTECNGCKFHDRCLRVGTKVRLNGTGMLVAVTRG